MTATEIAFSKSARKLAIDMDYARELLERLLATPSPSGYTDTIVHLMCEELEALGIEHQLTRRGAIRANLKGKVYSPDRAILAHVDTLGAMVRQLKDNGRLAIKAIGHWSSRFAEGARVTVFTDSGARRGTILPLKASGHTFNEEIDTQPVSWDQVELRVDVPAVTKAELEAEGFNIGDFIAIDPQPEFTEHGFVVSRHLDDKAGVAATMAAAKAVIEAGVELPVDCHLLFTISEEVGSGASSVLYQDVAEIVAVDNGTQAPGQNTREYGATIAMGDTTGPFDYHLTRLLLDLAAAHGIEHQRDAFRYYRCDAASAVEAGNDIRTALVTVGIDASHGYERCHLSAIESVAELLAIYMQSRPAVARDRTSLGSPQGFPTQPVPEAAE